MGAAYKMTTSGTVTILYSFGSSSLPADGVEPSTSLVQGADGNFYGMTAGGGTAYSGTIFKLTPLGQETILHNFGDGSVTNDGANPDFALTLASDGNFYGTTSGGGSAGSGVIFRISPVGQETILHSFGDGSVTNDGAYPKRL